MSKLGLIVSAYNSLSIQSIYLDRESFKGLSFVILDSKVKSLGDKPKKSELVEVCKEMLKQIEENQLEIVLIGSSHLFKILAEAKSAEPMLGIAKKCKGVTYFYLPDYRSVFYNPEKAYKKIDQVGEAVKAYLADSYKEVGVAIDASNGYFPKTLPEIKNALNDLLNQDRLYVDIEAFSLRFNTAGIGSIALSYRRPVDTILEASRGILDAGVAIPVDYGNDPFTAKIIRGYLKEFFESYRGNLTFHNIAYDATVLIYQLWMKDITDTEGLLQGISAMLKNFDDTKLIAYLATNTCAGNELGLKALSQSKFGNYAQEDINDIRLIPLDQLLEYNLRDCFATAYVYEQYYPIMVRDEQEKIYKELFLPSTIDIIQMQLTGLPLSMPRVKEVKAQLEQDCEDAIKKIRSGKVIVNFESKLNEDWVTRRNKELKRKKVTLADAHEEFNPRSRLQLRELFYDYLSLPILAKTDSKLPATDASTIEALMKVTKDQEVLDVLQGLLDFSAVDKILSAFIPSFEQAVYSPWLDWHFLCGNLNLGGTVSGRLSSSNPNLQNLPATGSKYAKLIKSCFIAPEGWLFCGLDFSALEDHISALTTKDPNKLAVYIHGYDGHCLRSMQYFKEQMPDVVQEYEQAKTEEEKVKVVNSIKERYKSLRQASKGPTFCLTYGGTTQALKKIFGFTEEEAKQIDSRYHELYKVSDEWVQDHIKQACKTGYVVGAFGLRARTPVLKQCLPDSDNIPNEARVEARTAGNMLGQSWCTLTNRAGVEFNSKVRTSKYKYSIKPVVHIHDAQYFLIKDDEETLLWANKNLVQAVSWQDDPAIYHPLVKLGGEFSIFYPDWAHEWSVPNECDEQTLENIAKEAKEELYGQ